MARFAKFASVGALVGGSFGYAVAVVEWLSLVVTPFQVLYGYAVAVFLLAACALLAIGQCFRDDFPLNRPDSLSRVAGYAPAWSKVLAVTAFAAAIAAPVLTFGGSIQLTHAEWQGADHSVRAAFFVAFAVPWFIALIGLKAVEVRASV